MKPKRQGRVQATAPLTSQWNCKGPCKGCEIDDVKTLACGGSDVPSNLQWQTAENCRAKDKWQRKENATSDQARRMRALFWLVPVGHTYKKLYRWLHSGYMTHKSKKPAIFSVAGFPYSIWGG